MGVNGAQGVESIFIYVFNACFVDAGVSVRCTRANAPMSDMEHAIASAGVDSKRASLGAETKPPCDVEAAVTTAPAHQSSPPTPQTGGGTTPAVAKCFIESAYALTTFAAAVTVGDPILVVVLHAAFVAVTTSLAVGSRFAPNVTRVARITCSDDALFVARAAASCTMLLFLASQVLAAPGFGLEAFTVVSAVFSSCYGISTTWNSWNTGSHFSLGEKRRKASRTAVAFTAAAVGALACVVGAPANLQRGPSLFPLTQFDGVSACFLLLIAMVADFHLRRIESQRDARITEQETRRRAALEAAAAVPVAESPPPPPQTPTVFDPFSRALYAHAFGFFALLALAAMFRVSQPYEIATLDGKAGVYMLFSCMLAAADAVSGAYATACGGGGDTPRVTIIYAATRALAVGASWRVSNTYPSPLTTVGVILCLTAMALSPPPRAGMLA